MVRSNGVTLSLKNLDSILNLRALRRVSFTLKVSGLNSNVRIGFLKIFLPNENDEFCSSDAVTLGFSISEALLYDFSQIGEYALCQTSRRYEKKQAYNMNLAISTLFSFMMKNNLFNASIFIFNFIFYILSLSRNSVN
jgi:hypothetical protein